MKILGLEEVFAGGKYPDQDALCAWIREVLSGRSGVPSYGPGDDVLPSGLLMQLVRDTNTADARAWFEDAVLRLLFEMTEQVAAGSREPGDADDELLMLTASLFPERTRAPRAAAMIDRLLEAPILPGRVRARALQVLLALAEQRSPAFWIAQYERERSGTVLTVAAGLFQQGLDYGFQFLLRPDVEAEEALRACQRLFPRLKKRFGAVYFWDCPAFEGLLDRLPPELRERLLAVAPPPIPHFITPRMRERAKLNKEKEKLLSAKQAMVMATKQGRLFRETKDERDPAEVLG